MVDLWSR